MLKRVACYTCQHQHCKPLCYGCEMKSSIPMWGADRMPTRCRCLTVDPEEPCQFYQISDDIKNSFCVDESNGPIATCPQCGSYDTEWVLDDDYNYNKCHACGWSNKEATYNEEVL